MRLSGMCTADQYKTMVSGVAGCREKYSEKLPLVWQAVELHSQPVQADK